MLKQSYHKSFIRIASSNPTQDDVLFVGARWLNSNTYEVFECLDIVLESGVRKAYWKGDQGTEIRPASLVFTDFFNDGSGLALWLFDGNLVSKDGTWTATVFSGTEQYTAGAKPNSGQAVWADNTTTYNFPDFSPMTSTGVLVFSFWLKYNSGYWIMGDQSIYGLIQFGGRFGFSTGNGDVYGVSGLSIGTWYHIVAEFQLSSANIANNKLWINGTPQTLTQTGTPLATRTLGAFGLGHLYNYNNVWGSDIQVDHLRIFNRPLTNAEVLDLFNEL